MTYGVKELGAALGLSTSAIYEGLAAGRIIAPVRIGRRVFWRKSEIELWLDAGCPVRHEWEHLKSTSKAKTEAGTDDEAA